MQEHNSAPTMAAKAPPVQLHAAASETAVLQGVLVQRDPLSQVTCHEGDASCAGAHAQTLQRSTGSKPERAADALKHLQRKYGNRYVQRLASLARQADQAGDAPPEVEQSIDQARGGGHALDGKARTQMETALDADFSGVRVHTDSRSDALNRSLSARAFTTGQDIFFKQGEYSPGSAQGRELLAHELTHVVQQNGDRVHTKLTVGQPDDEYEQEADQTAASVMRQEQTGSVQRQPEEADDQEDLPVQTKPSERQRPHGPTAD